MNQTAMNILMQFLGTYIFIFIEILLAFFHLGKNLPLQGPQGAPGSPGAVGPIGPPGAQVRPT